MLRAYFDDAGSHAGAPVVVVGGLVGTVDQWESLEEAWERQLANPLPEVGKPCLSMFHMSPCEAGDGEFEGYKPVERALVAQHFRRVIARSNLASTASAIDVAAWDDLVTGPVRGFLGAALEKCFMNCLDRVRDYAFDHPNGKYVAVVFDQGIENDRLHELIDLYKRGPEDTRTNFSSIIFAKVKDYYPLQAADLVATQNYWLAQEWLGVRPFGKDVDISFREIFKDRPFEGQILDRAGIEDDLRHRGPDGRLLPVANILMTRGSR